MLKVSMMELFLRGIPEASLFIFASYSFSKTALKIKSILLSSLLLAISCYFIRLMPIQFGVNTMLSFFSLIIILVLINKISLVKTVKVGIIIFVTEFICEDINIIMLKYVLKKDLDALLNNHLLKILYGYPSLFLFALIILSFNLLSLKSNQTLSH